MVLSLDDALSLVGLFLAGVAPTPALRRIQLDALMRGLHPLPDEQVPNLLVRLGIPGTGSGRRGKWSQRTRLRQWLKTMTEEAAEQAGQPTKEGDHGLRSVPGAAGAAPEEVAN